MAFTVKATVLTAPYASLASRAACLSETLRGLGATLNVFAIESSMDELAERAGIDPVAYRLSVLSDARARAVVEHAARFAEWKPELPPGTGRGRGTLRGLLGGSSS